MGENQTVRTTISPWLSVADVGRALDYYRRAFGAEERYRLDDESGRVMVAELAVDGASFWLQDDPDATASGDGRPVRMIVTVPDPDAVFAEAIAAGGTEVAAVAEDHGWRIGRFADPFGHHWEVGRRLPS